MASILRLQSIKIIILVSDFESFISWGVPTGAFKQVVHMFRKSKSMCYLIKLSQTGNTILGCYYFLDSKHETVYLPVRMSNAYIYSDKNALLCQTKLD